MELDLVLRSSSCIIVTGSENNRHVQFSFKSDLIHPSFSRYISILVKVLLP